MRCMSFALESCERKEGIYSIFDLLKYNFYLPFFFFGPVMTFDQFHAQVSVPRDLSLVSLFGFNALRRAQLTFLLAGDLL